MIQLEPKHMQIVLNILNKYPYSFYAFGSRSRGHPRKFSDLDLCFMDPIPWNIRAKIDEDFEESDLPFKVDLVDWNMCDQVFQEKIGDQLQIIQKR